MKLSILVPIYNEEANLDILLKRLMAIMLEKEIIAIDDCSNDQSPYILKKYVDAGVIALRHETNQGKGAAIRTGLARATGEYVIIQDADNELDPNDIPRLLEPVQSGKATIVYGARNLRVQSWPNYMGNKIITQATNILFGTRISDMETCYKLLPLQVMRSLNLHANSFDIEPEITVKLALQGYSITEVPITYHPRVQDKKMRPLKEGLRAILLLVKYRFGGA